MAHFVSNRFVELIRSQFEIICVLIRDAVLKLAI